MTARSAPRPSASRPSVPRPSSSRPTAHQSARSAGLRYASSDRPGFGRRRSGRGFTYFDETNGRIRDTATLRRIRALAIPPAWIEVWICADPAGHLQATGRDARGRKQYRYHADWRRSRSLANFDRMPAFGAVLPRIRRRCAKDLASRTLSRAKVLAAVVRLLELSLIRVGNDEYARLNHSFGLTTLRNRHVRVRGSAIRFRFRGKSGKQHEVDLRDRRLAAVVRRCQALPGQELFAWIDADGQPHDVTSDDINAYLREAARADVTASDFRTWAGTVQTYQALHDMDPTDDPRVRRHNVVAAIRVSAEHLGNTESVARTSYVHPVVIEDYLDGARSGTARATRPATETAVIALLGKRGRPSE